MTIKKLIPNFLIIGAPSSATSALRYYLNQHPEIFMAKVTAPWQEPKFFLSSENHIPKYDGPESYRYNLSITNLEDYKKIFINVKDEIAVGEKTTQYLYSEDAAERIHEYNPEMKIIVILRNPVDRAYSNYLRNRRNGTEKIKDFKEAIKLEEHRILKNFQPIFHYIKRGFYFEALKNYFELFGKDKMRIYIYDDFKDNPIEVLKNIFSFLEVNDSFKPKTHFKPNFSYIPKLRIIHSLSKNKSKILSNSPKIVKPKIKYALNRIDKWNQYKPDLNPNIREKLKKVFSADIKKTQNLVDMDLSHWL